MLLLGEVITSLQCRLVPQDGHLATNPCGQVEGHRGRLLQGAGYAIVPCEYHVDPEPKEHLLAKSQGEGTLGQDLGRSVYCHFYILDGVINFDLSSSPPMRKMNCLFIAVCED